MRVKGQASGLEDAARRLGHRFERLELLEQALTHSSIAGPARPDYQRFEFLGDRVLGLVIAEILIARRPEEAEGQLAPRLNDLVRKETCADIAMEIGVADWLRLGKSESVTGGRRKTAILGDAMEAVIAAVYLDGGLDAARALIARFWMTRIEQQGAVAPRDAKTALQEWAQAKGMRPPRYETVNRRGPDHAPIFTVAVSLDNGAAATAEAKSKRGAEQDAAAELLARIGVTT